MLEMLGVVAIIAVLALVVLQSVLANVKQSKRNAEATSMASLAGTLKTTILRTKYIPAQTNWAQTVASYLAESPNKVSTTIAGTTRLLLVDPALRLGTNAAQGLPYTQNRDGSLQPVSPRVLLLSSLVGPLPALTNDAVTFSNAWNTPPDGVPAGWGASWAGRGQDLRILRLDFGTLFNRVVLENLDTYTSAPYSVETTNTLTVVPPGSRRMFWLLDTTVLNFHAANASLQAREYVTEDVSYTFENGRWGRYVRYGLNRSNGWFGEMVDRFLAAPRPPYDTRRFASQAWTIESMYVFLWNFGQWSLDDFPSGPPWPHTPAYELSSTGAGSLVSCSDDLLP